MPAPPHELYEFGAFRLETAERRLSREGKVVPLAPKVFDTLVLLLDNAGHLVTKDELMTVLWRDMVVEEANLTKNIWLIRKALGEESAATPFIETVPKVGYRWVAPVRCGDAPRLPVPSLAPPPPIDPLPPAAESPKDPPPAQSAGPAETEILRPPAEESPEPQTHAPALDEGSVRSLAEPPAGEGDDGPRRVSPSSREPRRLPRALAAVIVAAALLAAFLLLRRREGDSFIRPGTSADAAAAGRPVVPARPSVAVLGFYDLSHRDSTAWLSTALSEMVASELAAGERARLVAAEEVVRQDVPAPAGMLSAATLARLRRSLGADFIVRGAYASIPGESGDRLRLDVVVQDARTGETAGTVSATGMENDLFQLVTSLGAGLRGKLGLAAATPAEEASVAASLPKNPEAARLYAEGLDRLRRLDPQEARGLLSKAAILEPRHPLIAAALSRAWSALGYDEKALQEAQRAYDLSANLSREDRLAIEARLAESKKDWDRAIEIDRTLAGFFPDRLDYGLKLAQAQTSGGKAKDALVTIARLSRLPRPERDDPRIDLAEASAAAALSDTRRRLAAATRAASKAAAEGRNGLLARARNEEAGALETLGDAAHAAERREEVARLFEADGDVSGAAGARMGLANVLMAAGDWKRAAALYAQALGAFQRVGNKFGQASAFSNLCNIEWLQGNVEKARGYARDVIAIRREIHDRSGTAWALTVLGNFMVEDGNFAEAYRLQNEALGISREIGDRSYASFCLDAMGGAYEAEGRLPEAEKSYRDALAISEELEDPQEIATRYEDLGNLAMDRGEIEAAERDYLRALDLRVKSGDESEAAEMRMQLAQLRHKQGRFAEAVSLATGSARAFEQEKQQGNLAISEATIARAEAALGRGADARRDAAKARALVSTSHQNGAILPVLLAAARVEALTGDRAGAHQLVAEALRRAERVKWRIFILEARLVEAELDLSPVRRPAALAALSSLAQEARTAGFGLMAREADDAMSRGLQP